MQTPLASPSARKEPPDSALYGRHLSIVRFCAAIALFLITLVISFVQSGSGDLAMRSVQSLSEFSLGMPLP